MPKPSLLIESWLPIEAFSAESKREHGAKFALAYIFLYTYRS